MNEVNNEVEDQYLHTYTLDDQLADGTMLDISSKVNLLEYGIKIPVVMSKFMYQSCIAIEESGDSELRGRLHDTLMMFLFYMRAYKDKQDFIFNVSYDNILREVQAGLYIRTDDQGDHPTIVLSLTEED